VDRSLIFNDETLRSWTCLMNSSKKNPFRIINLITRRGNVKDHWEWTFFGSISGFCERILWRLLDVQGITLYYGKWALDSWYSLKVAYPWEIYDGFKRFATFHNFKYLILDGIEWWTFVQGDHLFVLAENGPCKHCWRNPERRKPKLGQDVRYNLL